MIENDGKERQTIDMKLPGREEKLIQIYWEWGGRGVGVVESVEKKEMSKREGTEWHNGTENVKWNDKQDNYWLIVWHMNTSWKCAGKCARLPNNSYHYNTFAQHFFYTRSESDKSNLSQFCTLCIASGLRRVDSMLPSENPQQIAAYWCWYLLFKLLLFSIHHIPSLQQISTK